MTDQVVTAAVPTAINVLTALKTFFANLGTDPAVMPAKLPGAAGVLLGTVELAVAGLVPAEVGAVQADINSRIDATIAKLQASKPA